LVENVVWFDFAFVFTSVAEHAIRFAILFYDETHRQHLQSGKGDL
jgi:hypothetical protein